MEVSSARRPVPDRAGWKPGPPQAITSAHVLLLFAHRGQAWRRAAWHVAGSARRDVEPDLALRRPAGTGARWPPRLGTWPGAGAS